MKKILIIGLLAAVLLTPSFSYAQTQEEVNAQLLQIINSLMAQVQTLMAKLVEMQTQQIADSQKIDSVVQQTQVQSFGGVSEVVVPSYSVSVGEIVCLSGSAIRIPINLTGDWGNKAVLGLDAYLDPLKFPQGSTGVRAMKEVTNISDAYLDYSPETDPYKSQNDPNKIGDYKLSVRTRVGSSNEIPHNFNITNPCQ